MSQTTINTTQRDQLIRRLTLRLLLAPLLVAAMLFVPAGTLRWPTAWAYLAAFLTCVITSTVVLIRRDPDLLAERLRLHPTAKRSDLVLAILMAQIVPAAALIVAGFEHRFGQPSAIPLSAQVAGFLPMIAGYLLVHRAMLANTFFSAVVRIQTDRGHRVVNTGPYRYIRHPGYLGALLFYLPTPLILGAPWAFVPMAAIVPVTVVRILLEERTLRTELPGYIDYIR